MPWSGTGTYTRGYASWTSDATNGLPISATKFDTEDNDFAAGIQNCLTIDNQNKPNASLTWAQALALTKGTDATVFSIARTGGTNNPSLTWSVSDSGNSVTGSLNTGNPAFILNPSLYTFGNSTDNSNFTFAGTGYVTIGGATSLATRPGSLNLANASQPDLSFTNTSAGSNLKFWDFYADSTGIFHARLINDANNAANDWLAINRTSFTSALVQFPNVTVQIADAANNLWNAGYLGLPQNSQGVNYVTVLADQAKQLYHGSGSPHTYTIAANASVAYPLGTVLHFVNPGGSGILTISSSDTLTLVPAGTTGSRTLTAPGVATAEKIGATSWLVYGSNLT